MTRPEAEIQLKKLFGFDHFHDLQWEVIEELLAGHRILFVEKTGYGKSLCFQFPATQLKGVTIVFSPLIALMRDQVRSMLEKGIKAAAINSNQTTDENDAVIELAQSNNLEILYIAPERLENAAWISAAREMKIAMIVIDEAHSISMWGQSFRPNYRRIVNLVKLLPTSFPVLATTATATARVQEDIIEQVGSGLKPVRGRLLRSNISLSVVNVNSEDEKFYWLAVYMPKLAKTGIVYTGTQADTEIYSNWLQFLGYKSAAYSGRLDSESRKRVETDFIANKYDAVVSTNALGMGIDKPDIRFIIHTQIPQSPIHYYQEIGRSGRDGREAHAILLYNAAKDHELPEIFIEGAKPSVEKYESIISITRKALLGRNEIIKAANLKQTQVNMILSDLVDQGIINEVDGKSKKYFYNPEAPVFDPAGFDLLRKVQREELNRMIEYTHLATCRMEYLCNYLGDHLPNHCGICDVDKNSYLTISDKEAYEDKVQEFRETYFPVLEVESARSKIINGVAASYYGVTIVGAALHHSKYENGGDFPNWLLKLTLKAFRKRFGNTKFDLILFVPPTESGKLVENFAIKISTVLKIPISDKLVKKSSTSPQKVFHSGISKKDNVKDKFIVEGPEEVEGKNILLIDDIFDSGYTIKEIGHYLTTIGANTIAPLVIARTVGGDI
jgi:ATP-dependent DNA helicase RecQ